MFTKIEHCPICGNTSFRNFIICKDHAVTGDSFAIVQCSNCDFKFTNPRPDENSIGKYYESEDYISHSNKSNSLINSAYKVVRKFTTGGKIRLINELDTGKKKELLDVGCGTGTFLDAAKQNGWNVTGVEPNTLARNQAEQLIKSEVFKSLDAVDNKYNIITLWHVLEHVPDLNETMSQLKKLLKPKGRLVIAVPNSNSYDAQNYQDNWAGYDVPRHFYHFNQKTFKNLLKKHKLKLKDTLPMKWDAFYISLLSERYMNGSNNYVKSIINGYKSNSYAKEHKNNYSSLIYVVKK